MSEISKSLIVSFDALNLVKGIKSIGGPDKQVFYIESNLFAPDRRITPLILQPYILVEDPHNIIPSGDKVSELSSAEWYFDEIKSENRITAKEENASIDTPFALGANNSLHIRKNVEKAIQLFFEAEYLDTRKNKNIHISLTYLLSTTQSSEVKPAPKLKLSKPQSWKYCPLDKATEATIEAEVFANNKGYKSAVEWCKVEEDKVIPLANEAFVLGGQNTDKLKVNPHVMGDSLIRARNVSEEAYNKAYGINPEWDSRMKEVFENRNLALNTSRTFVARRGALITTPYRFSKTLKAGTTISFFYHSSKKTGGISTFFGKDWIAEFKPNVNNVFTLKSDVNKDDTISMNLVKGDEIDLFKLKIETETKSTPYTPAPEDLNWENLLIKSGGKYLPDILEYTDRNIKEVDGLRCVTRIKDNQIIYLGIDSKYVGKKRIEQGQILTFGIWLYATTEGYQLDDKIHYGANSTLTTWNRKDIKVGEWNYYTTTFKFYSNSVEQLYKFHLYTNILKEGDIHYTNWTLYKSPGCVEIWQPSIYDIAPDGIIKGSYQSDIKFTKYFPEINAEILFLTGDSIRPENKVVKAQAIFTTNKEPINNPSEFFDIEWYLDPVEAGGEVKKIGTGEFMEIPVSDLQLKGGRLVPIRLKYNFK